MALGLRLGLECASYCLRVVAGHGETRASLGKEALQVLLLSLQ